MLAITQVAPQKGVGFCKRGIEQLERTCRLRRTRAILPLTYAAFSNIKDEDLQRKFTACTWCELGPGSLLSNSCLLDADMKLT